MNRIVHANGNSKLHLIMAALVVVILFVASFQLSGVLLKPASQATDSSASANPGMGGVGLVNPPHPLQDFTLTSKSGDPIALSDLRGRAVVLFFGYTHCPDVCPTTLADYRRIKHMLGDKADQVAFVFVSVDGGRDTPEQMTAFLDQFDPDFIGMTGDEDSLRRIGAEYGLIFSEEYVNPTQVRYDMHHAHPEQAAEGEVLLDQENYFVQHTSPSFMIDSNGILTMIAFYGTKPEAMVASIRQLLQETSP